MALYVLDFKSFPRTFNPITIPQGCVMFRGFFSIYPELSDRPAFYSSSKHVSLSYGDTLGIYKTNRPLQLLDLRFIKSILSELLSMAPANDMRCTLSLAFGVCSLRVQLELLKQRYRGAISEPDTRKRIASVKDHLDANMKGLFDVQGFRIAETTNDAHAMLYLKNIFELAGIDGYISQGEFSPYHIERTDKITAPEFVLFNPVECLVKDEGIKRVKVVALDTLLKAHKSIINLHEYEPFYIDKKDKRGGGYSHKKPRIGLKLDEMSEAQYLSILEKTKREAQDLPFLRVWNKTSIGKIPRPVEAQQVSPWIF